MDVINCISTNEPNQTSNSCNNRVFLCSHSHQKQKKTRSKPSIEPDSRTVYGKCVCGSQQYLLFRRTEGTDHMTWLS